MYNKLQNAPFPINHPEQIIFEKRDDGFYNTTAKIYVVDPDDKSKTKIACIKCVCEITNSVVEIRQNNNVIFTVEFLEDEEEETKGVFNDEDIQTHD